MSARPATARQTDRRRSPAAAGRGTVRAQGTGNDDTARRRAAAGRAAARRRAQARRRRFAILLVALVAGGIGTVALVPTFEDAVEELTLPLRHEEIIREEAADKNLDPALVAAVIFAESHFRDQTSSAGAKGLMQITPETAAYIARLSGGTAFVTDDLSTPEVNIAYGSYYLRYLLDRYDGDATHALAAYNGGEGNVDRWIRERGGLTVESIPFPETRHYVAKVLDAREDYRRGYRSELGL
jgi:soluble lytic murein transglycosylase